MATAAAQKKFEALRARYVAARAKRDDEEIRLGSKWGHQPGWKTNLRASDRGRLERLDAAVAREKDKFFANLEVISPRDWTYGVPSHWVLEKLTFEDAVRPVSERLSVVPPLSYGSTSHRMNNNREETSMKRNTQQRFSGFGAPLQIRIPKLERYTQIGGDMDPGKHGGLLARSDGNAIELHEIQNVRDLVGDGEAAEVGFPFWSREAYYDEDDLSFDREEVKSALQSVGLDEDALEEMTPEQRALAIAEALFEYGDKVEEAAAGWSDDVVPGEVEWWGKDREGNPIVEGSSYIADEDDEFRREILGEDEDEDEDDEYDLNENPGSEYGQVYKQSRGAVDIVVRKVYRKRGPDQYHVRVLDPQFDEYAQSRKAVLFRGDEDSESEAVRLADDWLHSTRGQMALKRVATRVGDPKQNADDIRMQFDGELAYFNKTWGEAKHKSAQSLLRFAGQHPFLLRDGYPWAEIRKVAGDKCGGGGSSSMRSNATQSSAHSKNLDKVIYNQLSYIDVDGQAGETIGPPYTVVIMIRDGSSVADEIEAYAKKMGRAPEISKTEANFLRTKAKAGILIFEDEEHSVQIVYYDSKAELDKDWEEAEAKLGSGDYTQNASGSLRANSPKFEIIEGAARMLFVSPWADAAEEAGESFSGMQIEDAAPETPVDVIAYANTFIRQVEVMNGDRPIVDLFEEHRDAPGRHTGPVTPEAFGQDLAMQAQGHGVSWYDDHPVPRSGKIKLPDAELWLSVDPDDTQSVTVENFEMRPPYKGSGKLRPAVR